MIKKSLQAVIGYQAYMRYYNITFGKELLYLLEAYGKIATGKASDEVVEKIFNWLKHRLVNVHNWYSKQVTYATPNVGKESRMWSLSMVKSHTIVVKNIEKIQKNFFAAKNRTDKVLCIDAFMHFAHTETMGKFAKKSNVIAHLWTRLELKRFPDFQIIETDAGRWLEYLAT